MITRIVIPQLFENMEEATIGVWLKAEGAAVSRGDVLCELITEKSTFELEAEAAGVLLRQSADEKSIVPVGFIIGIVGESDDELPDIEAENRLAMGNRQSAENSDESALRVPLVAKNEAPQAKPSSGGRVRATPAARRLAKELNKDLEIVAAAHPGKVLSEDDVRNF